LELRLQGCPQDEHWADNVEIVRIAFQRTKWKTSGTNIQVETANNVVTQGKRGSKRKSDNSEEHPKRKKKLVCFFCKREGHFKKECSEYKKWKASKAKEGVQSYSTEETHCMEVIELSEGTMGELPKEVFLLDSGASCHSVTDVNILEEVRTSAKRIKTANGSSEVQLVGTARCGNLVLEDAIYLEHGTHNLVSLSRLLRKGFRIVWNYDKALIYGRDDKVVTVAHERNGVYVMDNPGLELVLEVSVSSKHKDFLASVHASYGHASVNKMLKIVESISEKKFSQDQIRKTVQECEVCLGQVNLTHGKQHLEVVKKPGHVLCADVIGPIKGKYGLIVIDKFSTFMIGNVLESRSEVSLKTIETVKEFISLLKLGGYRPIFLRTDNEFATKALAAYYRDMELLNSLMLNVVLIRMGVQNKATGI